MDPRTDELRIQWPFAARQTRLNTNTDLLKLIAMLTMFIDHAGKMLFPRYQILRIIGRIAFPIFAYTTAVGCVYTRDPLRYLKRMTVLALITQPIYAMALRHTVPSMFEFDFAMRPIRACIQFYVQSWVGQPSVLLTLIIGIVLIICLRNRHISLFIAVALAVWFCRGKIDYGWQGVALILLMYMFIDKPALSIPCVAAFILWWGITRGNSYHFLGVRFSMETFAVFALPLIYIPMRTGKSGRKFRMPKWLTYGFYPGHMIVIYLLDTFVLK